MMDAHIRRRIRGIIIKQKKKNIHLYRHLVTLVSRKAAATTAYCGRGIWYQSHTAGINRAYPNQWFHGKLFCLLDKWRQSQTPQIEAVSGQLMLAF